MRSNRGHSLPLAMYENTMRSLFIRAMNSSDLVHIAIHSELMILSTVGAINEFTSEISLLRVRCQVATGDHRV